jgi:hypothetical protein
MRDPHGFQQNGQISVESNIAFLFSYRSILLLRRVPSVDISPSNSYECINSGICGMIITLV